MTDIDIDQLRASAATTADAQLKLNPGANPLAIGQHTFELTVVDDSGNESAPARVRVIVADTQAPTAVLDVRDANGQPLTNNRVPFGAAFRLDGSRSADIGGQIVKYTWKLID
jgi:hypothetical protein